MTNKIEFVNLVTVKKINNKLTSNLTLPFLGIGSLILSIYIIQKVNFIPDLSLCGSYPNTLCKLPVIRLVLGIFSTKFWAVVILYIAIFVPIYLVLNYFGFKKTKGDLNYKETKADKRKWNRYGLYAALIFAPFYFLFLVFFSD